MINALITGVVGRDAEIRDTRGEELASFSVASNRKLRGEERTTWVRCTIWGKRARTLAEHIVKGKRVAITGSLELVEHNGRSTLECRVGEIEFLGGGERRSEGTSPRKPERTPAPQARPIATDDYSDLDEGEAPF